MSIKGFPTLYFFNHGTKMDYNGGRSKDTIIDWINKKTGPASLEVDCDKMQSSTADAKLAISYFGESAGALWDAYMDSARNPAISEKFSFFHTTDAACAEKYGASAPGVALSRKFDESPLSFSGSSADEIVDWAKASSVPTLITFSEDYIEPIFGEHKDALILFTEESGKDYQSAYAQAAKEMSGDILFVTSGVTDGIQGRLGEFLGVGKENLPTLRIISPKENMLKYLYEGDVASLNSDAVRSFVADFKDGKLSPNLKSEDIPEPATTDGLTVLVGKSWNDVVLDANKDVLVKYYAPWCGHCKSLAPIWDELAKETEGIEDLVIAKFDATANEVAGLEIRGYPTLKFYPKDNKAGVDYSGDRDLAAFQKYLGEKSTAYQAAKPAEAGGAQEEL